MVINVSDYRCDALIIEKRGLQALRLPDLNSKDVQARAATLGKLVHLGPASQLCPTAIPAAAVPDLSPSFLSMPREIILVALAIRPWTE